MSIAADYLRLVDILAGALPRVEVTGLYLPPLVEDGEYRDEFGFVFLSDRSVGPFYASLGPILGTLWRRYPLPGDVRGDPVDLARGVDGGDLAERALAIGAFNALSQRLMRRAGFQPQDPGPRKEVPETLLGVPVGLVGYFCSVIDRLVDAGREVLVLERQPERVPERPGVRLTTRVADLAECGQVLRTASVLINDSLDELLDVCRDSAFELIGPSGSGLPDALFAGGLRSVGGIHFDDPARLRDVLARGESWGSAGRKYQIRPRGYPGLDALIARCES